MPGYRAAIDLVASCRAEIVGLHEFFADWFNGALDDSDAAFARFPAVLHPDFSMVTPSGEVLERPNLLADVRRAHASVDLIAPVRIEIVDVVDRVVSDGAALFTYEEWAFTGDRLQDRRTSTVLFLPAPAVPNGVAWRHLHETRVRTE